jgi:hypothetical protein
MTGVKSRLTLLMSALLLFLATPAAAQSVDEIADEAISRGFYIADGLSAQSVSDQISDQVARAGNDGVRLLVVLLDANPSGGAVTFGDNVLDRVSGGATVLVLSASQEALVSDVFDEATRERALDRGFDASQSTSGSGDLAYVTAVVDVLTGSSSGGSSGSGGGGLVFLLIVVAVIGVVVFLIVRSQKKTTRRRAASRLEEARTEIKAQLDAMANTILEITDQVRLSAPEEDNAHLEAAGATYTEAMEAFENATDLRDLEGISDRLDEAHWQLDAAEAISKGEDPPPKPKPAERASCFFDPTHSGPFEDAEVATPAGEKTVRVCRKDADLLRKGGEAKPRMIQVDGRPVPAPRAPRSHGGGGFDLGTAISILVGGMAGRRSYDWGTPSRRSTGSWGRSGGGRSGGSSRTRSTSSRGRSGRSRGRRR